jgi:hypothetical protein
MDYSLTHKETHDFKQMILEQGHALAFSIGEIGCVDPRGVTPMEHSLFHIFLEI